MDMFVIKLVMVGALVASVGLPVSAEQKFAGFICADDGNKRIAIFDASEKCVWEYPAKKPYVVHVTSNGNVLLVTGHGVKLVSPSKEIVWEYKTKSEVYGADLLPDGGVLVGECTTGELVHLDAAGKEIDSFKTTYEKGGHMTMRNIRLTPQQTVLVGHLGDNCVREYRLDGQLVNEFKAPSMAYMGIRLSNGNTLVSHKLGVVEFKGPEKVVWEIKGSEVPEMGCKWITVIQPLENGNIVIGNWLGHGGNGKGISLFEVTRAKEAAWKFEDGAALKQVTAFKSLDGDQLQLFQSGMEQ